MCPARGSRHYLALGVPQQKASCHRLAKQQGPQQVLILNPKPWTLAPGPEWPHVLRKSLAAFFTFSPLRFFCGETSFLFFPAGKMADTPHQDETHHVRRWSGANQANQANPANPANPASIAVSPVTAFDSLKMPTKASHPEANARVAAKEAYDASKKANEEYRQRLQAFKAANPLYNMLGKTKPDDPETDLNDTHSVPSRIKRTQDMTDDEAWKAVYRAREQERDAVIQVRSGIRATPAFKEASAAYDTYTNQVHVFAGALFRPFKDKDPKKGWEPSALVVTDGVAICITYEKTAWEKAEPKPPKKSRATTAPDLPPCDDYAPHANTSTDSAMIGGPDPGRKDIAKVVCIDNRGKKHEWGLSRGQYYVEGGFLLANRLQCHRLRCMRAHFATLQASDTAALRVTTSAELRSYLEWNAGAEATWWEVAFRRPESRAKMQRYVGKRNVLDHFFSALNRRCAGPARGRWWPTARRFCRWPRPGGGEAAVPPGVAFKACMRAFGPEGMSGSTSVEWEHITTKVSWETQGRKEMMYKRFDPATGRERLHHTAAKYPPRVVPAELGGLPRGHAAGRGQGQAPARGERASAARRRCRGGPALHRVPRTAILPRNSPVPRP